MIRCCSTLIWEVKRVNKLRVLIVDDSARTISLIKDSLSEDTEVEIVGQAENGVEAIEMIRETKPDVVFLDLIMPKTDFWFWRKYAKDYRESRNARNSLS